MKNNNKYRKVIFLLVMLLAVTVGFALLSTTLKINGVTGIKSNTWDIHWKESSIAVTNGSVSASTPTVNGTNNDTVNFSVNLELPGDFYEFSIDAENSGTIDGAISLISPIEIYDGNNTLLEGDDIPDYINFVVKYADDTSPAVGDVLKKTKTKKYRIRIEIDSNAEDLPTTNKTFTYKYKVEYEQYKNTKPAPSFANSSWEDIIEGYEDEKLNQLQEDMNNGVTREIQLDLDNNGTAETTTFLRIANLSKCTNGEISESACGLVLEFTDIIENHIFNPYTDASTNGDGNKGGWKYSEIRSYVNNNIYNALPAGLKNKIIDTTVISSHGMYDSEDFESLDKLYLFSTKEVYNGIEMADTIDDLDGITKQLDYYKKIGVTNSNYSGAKKGRYGSPWWLRSACIGYGHPGTFYAVDGYGNCRQLVSNESYGISPAFRLAE